MQPSFLGPYSSEEYDNPSRMHSFGGQLGLDLKAARAAFHTVSSTETRTPPANMSHLAFTIIEGEATLRMPDQYGISAGFGSACAC